MAEYPHPGPKPPRSLTDKTNAGERRGRSEMRNERETRLRYQISHFHNSTFLNKLSRLSHQTTVPPCSPLCFIFVLIPRCHGSLLRECPIVSGEKHWSSGLEGEVSLDPTLSLTSCSKTKTTAPLDGNRELCGSLESARAPTGRLSWAER